MEYRNLGKSGLQVSSLSLGSWLTFGKQIDDNTAERLMAIAYEHGVNFFDNAEIYARGQSEVVMGRILKKSGWDRSSFVVSSKAFFGDGGQLPNQKGLSRKHLFEACHAALNRLQVDYLDLYFCHRPDKTTPIEETVWAMNHLIAQGKILYWGTSEWSAQEITEAHLFARENHLIGPLMEQPQYNMFHRERVEVEYLPLFRRFGMGSTIWSPLASGVLTPKYLKGGAKADALPEGTRLGMEGLDWLRERSLTEERLSIVSKLNRLAEEMEVALPALAIAWCLSNPHISTVILGASKEEQLKANFKALDVLPKLTSEIKEQIETILGNKPVQPEF